MSIERKPASCRAVFASNNARLTESLFDGMLFFGRLNYLKCYQKTRSPLLTSVVYQSEPEVDLRCRLVTKLWNSLHLVILSCYLLTYAVNQNADAVVMSRNKMRSAIVELLAKYLVDD